MEISCLSSTSSSHASCMTSGSTTDAGLAMAASCIFSKAPRSLFFHFPPPGTTMEIWFSPHVVDLPSAVVSEYLERGGRGGGGGESMEQQQ